MSTVTLATQEVFIITQKTARTILKKYAGDHYCLELLRFFGTYPYARFNELAVIHALDDSDERARLRNALGRLVIDGVVVACIESGTHLYKLTGEEAVHDSVVRMGSMDWHQWETMLERRKQAETLEEWLQEMPING